MSNNIPKDYAKKIANLIHMIMPESSVEIVNDTTISVNNKNMSLYGLYQSFKLDEDENIYFENNKEILNSYLNNILNFEEKTKSLKDNIRNIYPRICNKSYISNIEYIPHSVIAEDIICFYAIDLPTSCVSISLENTIEAGFSLEELHNISISNIRRESIGIQPVYSRSVYGGTICTLSFPDYYISSRIILPELYDMVSPFLGGDFNLSIPNKDSLICFSKNSEKMVEDLKIKISSIYNTKMYPITDKIIHVTEQGMSIVK